MTLDNIITESINDYFFSNLITEKKESKKTKRKKKDNSDKKSLFDKLFKKDDDKENNKTSKKKKKKKKFRKNAIKKKGGLRGDFDVEDDEMFNSVVDDQEQSSIVDKLNNGFYDISAIAQELYPDHTKEGAQSQLRKKLEGEASDSGTPYKLKNKEVKKLRSIMTDKDL